jgi:hypothetical protein
MLLSCFTRADIGCPVAHRVALRQLGRVVISAFVQSVRVVSSRTCGKKDTGTAKCCFFEKFCYILGMECANLTHPND